MFPAQAVVRFEDGKLIVRTRSTSYRPVTNRTVDGQIVSFYKVEKGGIHTAAHDPEDVAVFDMKGNRLSAKAWKELLKSDVHALIARDGKLPNPREMTLFKADTLLVVLPPQQGAMIPPPPAVSNTAPQFYYEPVQGGNPPRTYFAPTPVRPTQPGQMIAPLPPLPPLPTPPLVQPESVRPADQNNPPLVGQNVKTYSNPSQTDLDRREIERLRAMVAELQRAAERSAVPRDVPPPPTPNP
jgi:hypothetical protein